MHTHHLHWPRLAIILTSSLLVVGCSSKQLIPERGPDILDVYQRHMDASAPPPNLLRSIQHERRDLAGYTRTAGTELGVTFPRLPNPELVMFVFPHLTDKGRPVPGYATSFLLFEADQYALPGEIAP